MPRTEPMLKPYPFCGSREVEVEEQLYGDKVLCSCAECGARGPTSARMQVYPFASYAIETHEGAVAAWNSRTDGPEGEGGEP